jgi:microcystin-dependent protein
MSTPYVGEIRMVGFNFAAAGWAFCDGSLLSIAEYDTLFNLIGTTYGGDGQVSFGLPDLRGRVPIHQGNGFVLSQNGGAEFVMLTTNQIPSHNHPAAANSGSGTATTPGGNVWAASPSTLPYAAAGSPTAPMAAAVGLVGGNQAHDNMHPYLTINYIISLYGVYPSPN